MKVTVGLRKSISLDAGQEPDLAKLLSLPNGSGVSVLKVFGRGRFASIEASPEGLAALKESVGAVCVFTRTPRAQAF